MRGSLFTLPILVALLSGGCNSGLDLRYLDSSLGAQLELPPDLSTQQAESSFELPNVFSGDDPNQRDKIPVLANVDSLRLQGSRDLYWLSVEEPVDDLYRLIKNFWAVEGHPLVVDEPVIGIMQTEWIYRELGGEDKGASWFESLFSSAALSASQDQFRTRIERDGQGGSRVYIAHRGTEYNHVIDTDDKNPQFQKSDSNEWKFRQPEPELEIEMLSRLMIFLGLHKDQVSAQVANVKLFSPRAFIQIDREENAPFLVLKDAYQIAWNRVYHQLERLNFEILSSDFKSGFSQEGVIRFNTQVAEADENAGGFRFFASNKSQKTTEMVLVLSEATHELTRVDLENPNGEIDKSTAGSEFLNFLYRQIK